MVTKCRVVHLVSVIVFAFLRAVATEETIESDIVPLNSQDDLGPISILDAMSVDGRLSEGLEDRGLVVLETQGTQDLGCDTYRTVLEVAYPGCVPRPVMTTACRGNCRSWTFPEWVHDTESVHMIENCTCCKPLVRRALSVRLDCPQRSPSRTKKIMVWAALECRCRPCSDGNPENEQPYDY